MSKAKKAQRKRARAKDRREKYLSVRAAPRLRPTVGDFYAVEAVQLYRRPQSWGEVNAGDLLKVVALHNCARRTYIRFVRLGKATTTDLRLNVGASPPWLRRLDPLEILTLADIGEEE